VKQYVQAGLNKRIPLITTASIDGLTIPALKELALGTVSAHMWSPDLENAENERFVQSFESKYGRIPSNHAAQGYDAAALLDSAIAKVAGDVTDKKSFGAALTEAKFKSVRGPFRFNNNHFPIENFYLLEVVRNKQGQISLANKGIIFRDHEDAFASSCAQTQ